MLFWRSAYVSELYSVRNRTLVLADWAKVKIFGRYVLCFARCIKLIVPVMSRENRFFASNRSTDSS